MKITMDGKYQTRDGRKVRLFSLNGPDFCFPIVGAIEGWNKVHTWRLDGRSQNLGEVPSDLVPVPDDAPKWLVIGKDGFVWGQQLRQTEEEAIRENSFTDGDFVVQVTLKRAA